MIAAARVKQSVVGIAGLRGWVEFNRPYRMREICDDVGFTKEFSPCSLENVGSRVGCMPLRDDVVVGHVFQREPGRDEVGRLGIAGTALSVHCVEQAVSRELRMKDEADESTLQPVIDGIRKHRCDVCINLKLVVRTDQIEEAARIIGKAAAIGKIAHKAHTRPACRRHVLIGGTNPARVRKAHQVLNLDRQTAFRNRRRNWVTRDLRLTRARGPDRN